MPFEPPQSGNPHQFTLNQHIHMAHCISKFYGTNRKVEVFFKKTGEIIPRKKDAAIFCAKRAWDERAEKGYMQDVEGGFRHVINSCKTFFDRDHLAITKYFKLWQLRHYYWASDIGDVYIPGISGSGLTKDQEEKLEAEDITYIREGGLFPARFMVGINIQAEIDMFLLEKKDMKWGLLQALSGEFICPDCCQQLAIIPISPCQALVANNQDRDVSIDEVRVLNKELVAISTDYYFARELSKCPR